MDLCKTNLCVQCVCTLQKNLPRVSTFCTFTLAPLLYNAFSFTFDKEECKLLDYYYFAVNNAVELLSYNHDVVLLQFQWILNLYFKGIEI